MLRSLFIFILAVVSLASLQGKEGYPPFSWDRLPVYAHFGVDPEMTPEQYDFIAEHFSFVTMSAGRVRDNVELVLTEACAELKKRNPEMTVLFYWASDGSHPPFTASQASFPEGGTLEVARKRPGGRTSDVFDRSSADVRAWWASVAAQAVNEYGFDGIFADGTHAVSARSLNGPISDSRLYSVNQGMHAMLAETQVAMGGDKLIIFNALHGDDGYEYMPVTDGAMIDRFDRDDVQTKETMAADLESMRQAGRDGKIICFKAWPDFNMRNKEIMKRPYDELAELAGEQITFPLASFLVAAGPNCYFQYTWGWLANTGTLVPFPEFDKPIGEPMGEAIRDGWTYRREFENVSVFVDLESRTAQIDWK